MYLFLIAKFVPGLDGMLPPLAGTQQQPFLAFFLFDAAGSALWSAFYSDIGYLFADRIEIVVVVLGRLTTYFAWAIVVPLAVYLSWRFITLVRMIL